MVWQSNGLHRKWMPLATWEASIFIAVENPDNYDITKYW